MEDHPIVLQSHKQASPRDHRDVHCGGQGYSWESGKNPSSFPHWFHGLSLSLATDGLIIEPHGLAGGVDACGVLRTVSGTA